MEAPWPLDLAQNDTQREIKHQKTPRDGAEHGEGEADVQETGDRRTQHRPIGIGRILDLQSRPAGGGSDVRETESVRGTKGPLDGRTPPADRDLDAGQGQQRWGNRMRYGSNRLAQGTILGRSERERSADKRWRTAGGIIVQADGRSAPGRFGGGKQVQKESEAASKCEKWGSNRS